MKLKKDFTREEKSEKSAIQSTFLIEKSFLVSTFGFKKSSPWDVSKFSLLTLSNQNNIFTF